MQNAPGNYQLPPAAQQRLQDLAQHAASGHTTALTDFSVDELILIEDAGFTSLGMVMGSSIYHIGFQIGKWGNQELQVLTSAMYQARELAMNRMRMEAAALQADGVVSVSLRITYHSWSPHTAEFTCIGTAVRHAQDGNDWKSTDGGPFTSHVSGQSLWKLVKSGYRPVGMVLGNCVYHIAYQGALQLMKQTGQNMENPTFTQAIYDARELAMGRMQSEAERLGADLVVESSITPSNHTWESHILEYFALGTAAKAIPGAVKNLSPSLVVNANAVM